MVIPDHFEILLDVEQNVFSSLKLSLSILLHNVVIIFKPLLFLPKQKKKFHQPVKPRNTIPLSNTELRHFRGHIFHCWEHYGQSSVYYT